MNYTSKFLRGSFLMVVSLGSGAILAYFTRIFLARTLAPEEYGLFFAALSFVLIFSFLRDAGLAQAIVKIVPEYRVKKQLHRVSAVVYSTLLFQLVVSLLISLLLFAFAHSLAQHYFQQEEAKLVLWVLAIYFPLSTLVMMAASVFRSFTDWKVSLIQPVRNGLILLFTVIFIDLGVIAPAIGYMFSVLFTALFLIPALRGLKKPNGMLPEFKKVFVYGLPLIAVGFSASLITQFDTLMLTYFSTLTNVGVYNVILPTILVFVMISSALGTFLVPIVSELYTRKKQGEIKEAMTILYKYVLILILPLIILLFAHSAFFLQLLFGDQYVVGALAFKILLLAVVFMVFFSLNAQILTATNGQQDYLKTIVCAVILNVLFNILLIPRFGMEGAAIGTGFSYLGAMMYSFYFVLKKFSFKISVLKTILASVLFYIVIAIINKYMQYNTYLDVAVSVSIGLIVYVILLFALNQITMAEVKKYLALFLNK